MKFRILKRKEVVGNNYMYAFQVMIGDVWQFVDLYKETGTHALIPCWYAYIEDCEQALKNYYYHYGCTEDDKVVKEFELGCDILESTEKVTKLLEKFDVQVKTANGDYRPTYDVLLDISKVIFGKEN